MHYYFQVIPTKFSVVALLQTHVRGIFTFLTITFFKMYWCSNFELPKCFLLPKLGTSWYFTCAVLCWLTQSCPILWDRIDCSPPGSSVCGDSQGKNTGVGCHALLQGIFPTQGMNPDLPHCRWILYHLSHQGSPYSCTKVWSDGQTFFVWGSKRISLALWVGWCSVSQSHICLNHSTLPLLFQSSHNQYKNE